MVMNVLVGLTSKEIAARSSLSAVAVRVRLCRARREIRARLADAPATLRAARMAPRFDAGPAWTSADSCC
jgi:DNA-directed RNA polymerase specialized sigma24 family protein